VPVEYNIFSSQNRGPFERAENKNGDLLENGSMDFEYILAISGDHFPI
jgi:hypothetical protein